MPKLSSYPVIDFALKTRHRTTAIKAEGQSTLHLSAGDEDIREALEHEYTMTPGARTLSSRQRSRTSPEGESEGESQRVLLGDEDVEIEGISAPSEALAP
jgi:hypothetical protein